MARKAPITQRERAFAFLKAKGMARLTELIITNFHTRFVLDAIARRLPERPQPAAGTTSPLGVPPPEIGSGLTWSPLSEPER